MAIREFLMYALLFCAIISASPLVNATEVRYHGPSGFDYHGTYVNYAIGSDTALAVLDTAGEHFGANLATLSVNAQANNKLWFPDLYDQLLDRESIDYSSADNFISSLADNDCWTTATYGDRPYQTVLVMTAWGLDANENLLPGYIVYKWDSNPNGVTKSGSVIVEGYPGHYHISHRQSYY